MPSIKMLKSLRMLLPFVSFSVSCIICDARLILLNMQKPQELNNEPTTKCQNLQFLQSALEANFKSESNQMESAVKMHHFIEEKDTSIAFYKEAFGLYN